MTLFSALKNFSCELLRKLQIIWIEGRRRMKQTLSKDEEGPECTGGGRSWKALVFSPSRLVLLLGSGGGLNPHPEGGIISEQ